MRRHGTFSPAAHWGGMTSAWLIANSNSRTTDQAAIAGVCEAIARAGGEVERQIDLANEELPDTGDSPPDMVVSLGGDGTANAVIRQFGGADGPSLLILPGGTMNLLSQRLHGDAQIEQVVERAFSNGRVISVPLIEGPDFRSLVGVIAGPASAWAEVREDLREGAVDSLIADVRAALEATFAGPAVRLRGHEDDHAALLIEAREDGLHAHDIRADSILDLIRHGWAWLRRDFLGGPTERLEKGRDLVIESRDAEIMLLVDGEMSSAAAPLTLRWGSCPARLIATADS